MENATTVTTADMFEQSNYTVILSTYAPAGLEFATQESSPLLDESSFILTFVVIIFGIFINVSNILIMLSVLKLQSASNPDAFIFSLSLVDFLMTLSLFPIAAYHFWTGLEIPRWACSTTALLITANILFSTTVVSLMTIDRLLAIKRPILYKLYLTTSNIFKLLALLMVISVGIAAVCLTHLIELQCCDGYCLFVANNWYTGLMLLMIYPQLAVVVYSYSEFFRALKKFIPKKNRNVKTKKSEKNSVQFCCQKRPMEDASVKSSHSNKGNGFQSINFKRCIRMSRTVAAIVILYYIPCLIWTGSILTDWILGRRLVILNHVSISLIMIDSTLNIFVYATMCLHYRRTIMSLICSPLRKCGLACTTELPLGLTPESEIKHISNRMVLDGVNSPGLIRRDRVNHMDARRSYNDTLPIDNPAFSKENEESIGRPPSEPTTHQCYDDTDQIGEDISNKAQENSKLTDTKVDSSQSDSGVDDDGIVILFPG